MECFIEKYASIVVKAAFRQKETIMNLAYGL